MNNTLVLCGGTGAHVGVAFLRLHTLGALLGFFENTEGRLLLPDLFLIDQDSGDGGQGERTAWQEAKRLLERHPGRDDWQATARRTEAPRLTPMTPLPVGADQGWYKPPHERLRERFGTSPLLPVFASPLQQEITYSQGMMGSPAVGAVLFDLKRLDSPDGRLNFDKSYGELLGRRGRIVVAASGVGGTGASVGPVVAERLATDGQGQSQVMAVMVLPWFLFDPTRVDEKLRDKAARRNRVMLENGSTALASYGQRLCEHVATLPIGVPERSRKTRVYSSDQSQTMCESYVHAVAALAAYQHFLRAKGGYPQGLYVQGAVEPGALSPSTPIPGGTLQSLANRAVTLEHLLGALDRVLSSEPVSHPMPALWQALEGIDRGSTAESLREMASHYREQITWLEEVLEVREPRAATELSLEALTRRRLRERPLQLRTDLALSAAATQIFRWASELVRDQASPSNQLLLAGGPVAGGHWPERAFDAGQVAPTSAAEPTPEQPNRVQMVLESFIDTERVTAGSWPHALAPAECFEYLLARGQQRARRQLELMLAGLAADLLVVRPLAAATASERVSLEALADEHRRGELAGIAELGLFLRHREREHLLGFNAPATLLCPAPMTGEPEEEALWQYLWQELTGDTSGDAWWKAVSPRPWRRTQQAVRRVRWWLERVSARFRGVAGSEPRWLQLFQQGEESEGPTPCALGRTVRAFWGHAAEGGSRLVAVELPSAREVPPELTEDLKRATPSELEARVPGFNQIGSGPAGPNWRLVDFEKPGGRGRGIWLEHLEKLRELERLETFVQVGQDLVLRFLENDELATVVVPGTEILSSQTIAVPNVFCVEPDPLRLGGPTLPRYPQAPLRSDYYGLLKGDHERSLFELVKEGKPITEPPRAPREDPQPSGELVLTWELALLGRSKPLSVEHKLHPKEPGQAAHAKTQAHWMVWPRFRSQRQPGWRAYYVYDWCFDSRVVLDVLWLDPAEGSSGGLRRREPAAGPRVVGGYPVAYAGGEGKGHHTGGPPLALVPRKRLPGSTGRDAEELGLFLVDLDLLGDNEEEVRLAVDFGSSHSVVAFQSPGKDPETIRFAPELSVDDARKALSRAISESKAHIEAAADGSQGDIGLISSGHWTPTYRQQGSSGLVLSEILLRERGERKDPRGADFLPMRDWGVPPFDLAREDLGRWIVSELKWNPADLAEPQQAKAYREHYLTALLELAIGELVAVHLGGLPGNQNPVDLIFTYPLRSGSEQIRDFQQALRRVLQRLELSTGLSLRLRKQTGLFDESRAARIDPVNIGHVSVVADLGGGTLDLFISAWNAREGQFRELADSVRVGGGVLLRALSRRAGQLLPQEAGWGGPGSEAGEVEAKLRALVRLQGAPTLFSPEETRAALTAGLGVRGYSSGEGGNKARALIDRYFRVVTEYVARSVTAYLVREWFPKAPLEQWSSLRVFLSLRGNGWRLRYQERASEGYVRIAEQVIGAVRRRVCELWDSLPGNQYPKPESLDHWATAAHMQLEDAKTFPVKQVVAKGKVMSYDEARSLWHSYTPVDLEVVGADGKPVSRAWGSPLPLDMADATHVTVRQMVPPIPLSSAAAGNSRSLVELEAPLLADLNRQLQSAGGQATSGDGDDRQTYQAPVGAIVWESLTRSRSFQGEE